MTPIQAAIKKLSGVVGQLNHDFDVLSRSHQDSSPLVLEQRPGQIIDYNAATNIVTWLWQSYSSTGDRIDHPNGLIGTPTFMPAFPIGNADFSLVSLPVEAWFRKRLSTVELGPVYEFDSSCCPPAVPASGGLNCCDGTTPGTITFHVAGSGDDCGDCSDFDVDLVFDVDSQRWRGSHDCTFGDCVVTFNFMLQCFSCASPPQLSDCGDLDCTDPTEYYYCLTWWITTSGDDCPPSQYGRINWSREEVVCDPFSLPGKPIMANLGAGIDCDFTIVVCIGCDFPPPCGDTLFVTLANGTGCSQFAGDSYSVTWNAATGRYEGSSAPIASLGGSVHSTWVQLICPLDTGCGTGTVKTISQTSLLPCANTGPITESCTTLVTPGDCCPFNPFRLPDVAQNGGVCDCVDLGPITPMAIQATLSV